MTNKAPAPATRSYTEQSGVLGIAAKYSRKAPFREAFREALRGPLLIGEQVAWRSERGRNRVGLRRPHGRCEGHANALKVQCG